MILLLVLLVALAYSGVCLIAGFGPPGTLDGFDADKGALQRRFRQPASTVVEAYRAGVAKTPGMRLVEDVGGVLLVDLRPTTRVLGGNFGLVIRLRCVDDVGGTFVVAESRNKVPFAWGSNHAAAFGHAETALRMNAKRAGGLDEVIPGLV